MPWAGFEPTISVFERAKTFHALDRTATVIGQLFFSLRLLENEISDFMKRRNSLMWFNVLSIAVCILGTARNRAPNSFGINIE
jgi:hypothetical protein